MGWRRYSEWKVNEEPVAYVGVYLKFRFKKYYKLFMFLSGASRKSYFTKEYKEVTEVQKAFE